MGLFEAALLIGTPEYVEQMRQVGLKILTRSRNPSKLYSNQIIVFIYPTLWILLAFITYSGVLIRSAASNRRVTTKNCSF